MTYTIGICVLFLAIFVSYSFRENHTVSAPFKSLSFFKLQYLALGMALSLLFPDRFMHIFEPARGLIVMFCLSWIGFYYGCGLELRAHQRFPTKVILFNLFEPAIIFVCVSLVSILFFLFKFEGWGYTDIALIIGAYCSFTIFRRHGILKREGSSSHYEILNDLLPVGDIIPIIALCIIGAVIFGSRSISILNLTFSGLFSSFMLIVIFGAAVGALLNMLISGADNSDAISIIMIGGVAFCGGLVYYFSFSPLFVGMISGAFLINSTLKRLQTLESLHNTNEIIEKIYMFILGTIVAPVIVMLKTNVLTIIVAAAVLFVFRASLKYILSYLWTKRIESKGDISSLMWIGLTGQGILASAAVYECALYADLMPAIIVLFATVLVLNQLAIGLYIWRHEPADSHS